MLNMSLKKVSKILVIFLLALPHLKPLCISVISPTFDLVFDIARLISFFFIFILIILRNKKLSAVTILILLVELWLTFTTFLSESVTLRSNLVYFGSAIAIPLLIECYSDDNMDDLITALMMNYEWLIYVNLITVLIYYPNGMFQRTGAIFRTGYFLGNENEIIFYALPAIFLSLLYWKMHKRTIRPILLIGACLANEIIVWCATGIVGLTVLLILLLTPKRHRIILNYYTVFITSVVVDVLLSVFRVFDRYSFLAGIITNILGKTMTLSGRTFIWDNASAVIKENLLFGLGRGDHVPYKYAFFHAHNQYLELLLEGGIPLLILFLLLCLCLGRSFSHVKEITTGKKIMLAALACLFVQFIATQRISEAVFIPFALAAVVDKIDNLIEPKKLPV